MRKPILRAAMALVPGIMGVTACTGDDVQVDPAFTAEITGAVTRSAAGVAAFGVIGGGASSGFTVAMEDETGVDIVLQKPATTRPLRGTYPIVSEADAGPLGGYRAEVRVVVAGALEQYDATSGTLVISESSPLLIKGTMAFGAVRTSPCCDPQPVTISVQGTFTALPGPVAAAR